jgi:cation-transporting ATPase 13A1
MFCASLWLLDEYWNYALFNVGMILMFEGGTTFSRQKSLGALRGMKGKTSNVMAWRLGRWTDTNTEDLYPGDVFSLKKLPTGDTLVPCDCLLLRGSAVVNGIECLSTVLIHRILTFWWLIMNRGCINR